jgi:hypothetical protein
MILGIVDGSEKGHHLLSIKPSGEENREEPAQGLVELLESPESKTSTTKTQFLGHHNDHLPFYSMIQPHHHLTSSSAQASQNSKPVGQQTPRLRGSSSFVLFSP